MGQNQPKGMDYSPWLGSIMAYFLEFNFLADFDYECTETNIENDHMLFLAEKSRKKDLLGGSKMGPKSAQKHGL